MISLSAYGHARAEAGRERTRAGERIARARDAQVLRRRRRRRVTALALVALAVAIIAGIGPVGREIQSITLPLRHADIIRTQAAAKGLDPALIAAVIFQESKFEDRTSAAGATGLMQILPSTARAIAKRSGGTAFVPSDLSTPAVNIAYGSYYLRMLIDHYDGNQTLAIAAYNAGEQNVDEWVRRAGGAASFDPGTNIPFAETRAYVRSVLDHKTQYRDNYPKELGYQ
jgi:soluble lytic murein transglycosylase